MEKTLAFVIIVSLVLSMFAIITPKAIASANVIFKDDFESYAVGTFPSLGGWQIVWNGAGDQYQVITDSYFNSPTKSLQLMGSVGWSSVVKKDFSSSSNVIGYEAYLMSPPEGGCSVAFCNIPIATWGRYYGMVAFATDGFIWACSLNNEGYQQLQPFTPYTWYKIRVLMDRSAKVYNVWIDDVLEGQDIPIYYDPWEILSLQFQVGWINSKGYFDDVKVFEVSGPTPTGPVISSVSPITATNLQTIRIYGSGFGNTQPQTVSLGDGSLDTVNSSTTPSIVFDDSGKWGAGWIALGVNCAIGIYLNSWSDNEIVLGGFGTALGTNGWNIAPGDSLDVKVFTPSGKADYKTTVGNSFTLTAGLGGSISYSYSGGLGTVLSGQSQQLTVSQGGQVSLTANPDSTHVFQSWSTTGSVSVSSPSSASTTATVSGNGRVTANFNAPIYSLTFTESGLRLCDGASWTVTLNGPNFHGPLYSTTNKTTFNVPANAYTFSVDPIAGYTVSPASGSVTVNGEGIVESITFSPVKSLEGISTTITVAYSLVANAGYSLQQNFYLFTGNKDAQGNPEVYWCQNVVEVDATDGVAYEVYSQQWLWKCYWTGAEIDHPTSPDEWFDVSGKTFLALPLVPDTMTFTSWISGGSLWMNNSIGLDPWSSSKLVLASDAYITSEFFSTCTNIVTPNFVIVGPGSGRMADFTGGQGTVTCQTEIGGAWKPALNFAVVLFGQATGESSIGLIWFENSQGQPSGAFEYQANAYKETGQEGVFFGVGASSGTAILSGGSVSVDQTSLTGVSVHVSGSLSPDGTLVTITTSKLTGTPKGIIQVGTTPAAYYDVSVEGVSDGTATMCITNSGVTSQTTMQYGDGTQWKAASDITVSGDTVFGSIPVSALGGTPIAIGPLASMNITFNQLGLSLDFTGTVVTIDGTNYTASELPVTFQWDVGSIHSFSFASPLNVNASRGYCWWSTSGLSSLQNDTLTVTASGNVTATFGLIGDFNHDGTVSLADLTMLAMAYHSKLGDANWNPECELAPPYGIIGLTDVVTFALHYGQHYP